MGIRITRPSTLSLSLPISSQFTHGARSPRSVFPGASKSGEAAREDRTCFGWRGAFQEGHAQLAVGKIVGLHQRCGILENPKEGQVSG